MIYPLAFGFANSECTKSWTWTWFLKKLHKLIQYPDHLMLVSDRRNDQHIKHRTNTSQWCDIHPIHFNKFKVDDKWKETTVDRDERSCSCHEWDLDEFPCSQAMSVAMFKGMSINALASDLYTTRFLKHAYEMSVNLVLDPEFWNIPHEIWNLTVLPWKKKKLIGRPKKLMIPSTEEKRKLQSCLNCGQKGHNKKPSSGTCKPAKKARRCSICKKEGQNKLKCPNKPPDPALIDMDEVEDNAVFEPILNKAEENAAGKELKIDISIDISIFWRDQYRNRDLLKAVHIVYTQLDHEAAEIANFGNELIYFKDGKKSSGERAAMATRSKMQPGI
ncbi:hypothetical protein Dsin_005425 [Dipteronia sinensis]|uniref:Zinc finger PMZ-type domain-containing protein n=1 Tax=Dipteronia sinensis TaxID=43782 RepID=A0AAE0EEL6_9ROSI|nr:hypothetical protein Dsin_005425 [Dipteronia sinensis]